MTKVKLYAIKLATSRQYIRLNLYIVLLYIIIYSNLITLYMTLISIGLIVMNYTCNKDPRESDIVYTIYCQCGQWW